MKRQSQQGIALVITLILLSVITFMAVTFLVVSRHEGEQVDTTTQQNVSRMAADGIEQMAVAQIIANLMGPNNGLTNLGLMVSTNVINPAGYDPVNGGSLFNVSYTDPNGQPLTQANLLAMLTNLLYLPRAPVFISTNKNQLNPEFRFYLDENGNGKFETNGLVMNQDVNGQPIPNAANPTFSVQVGDPEYVGFLEHPDQRHSASNFFLSRGAFIAIPIGDALDANAIHNQSRLSVPTLMSATGTEGFYRNQGVTSGELNLAAFLAMVNTNVWGVQTNNTGAGIYNYATARNQTSAGAAFFDAAAIMQYRNGGNFSSLNSFEGLYGLPTATPAVNSYLVNGAVDAYAVGPLMQGVNPPLVPAPVSWAGSPWSGANNPVQLVRPRDLMTMIPNGSFGSFTNRLSSIGTALDTYDRYTFYRILGQMGFSSAPEPAPYPIGGGNQFNWGAALPLPIPANIPVGTSAGGGRNQMSYGSVPEPYPYVHGRKMNLNWNNLTSTNFAPWTSPAQFFTNAADRLLRTYYPTNFAVMMPNGRVVVTNLNVNFIPIYPVNFYTPGVHRMLQLAANIYDASTNKSVGLNGLDYPSVFRPIFNKTGKGANSFVYISGYYEVSNDITAYQNAPVDLRRVINGTTYDVDKLNNVDANNNDFVDNIYGVPYVIGARPNLPNFNQLSTASIVTVTRAFQLTTPDGVRIFTNVSYNIGVSNVIGVQCWNSSTNYFNRAPLGVRILAINDYSLFVSNTFNGLPVYSNAVFQVQQQFAQPTLSAINPWPPGVTMSGGTPTIATSFVIPILTNAIGLTNGSYLLPNGNYSTNVTFTPLTTNNPSHTWLPNWAVNVTNRLRLIILDNATGRILDYAQLGGLGQLAGPDSQENVVSDLSLATAPPGPDIWNTNAVNTNAAQGPINLLPIGINNQLAISESWPTAQKYQTYWASAPGGGPNSVSNAIYKLNQWILHPDPNNPAQAPFAMTVTYAKYHTWSANDPLVHYMTGDLTDLNKTGVNDTNNRPAFPLTANQLANVLTNLNRASPRYQPWNTTVATPTQLTGITGNNQLQYRDPMVRKLSDMSFPGNKYPNVGWLGRVHRGTPWQTVYLKSTPVDLTINPITHASTWQLWTGNPDPLDAANTVPTSDWTLVDLFTTAPNDNASRGQLSVNQTNVAAWAAVLDSVMVISNTPKGPFATNISLTQSNVVGTVLTNTVQYLVSSNNAQRATVGGGVFSSVGQLFSTPQLTVQSPYINTSGVIPAFSDTNLTDAVYERIPQQIASLLRVGTPRYEIYAYGQALKPADKSIVQSGPSFGMCTNYQITGEVLTRTVVRLDNFPVPGQPRPGTANVYALPVQGQSTYVVVTNVVPPVRAVVESFEILGPDQ